jgi:hypothetical protein
MIFESENLSKRPQADLDEDLRILLKWFLKIHHGIVLTGFIRLRTGTSGRLL